MTKLKSVMNLENYLINPSSDSMTVAVHRIGEHISYEAACYARNHLSESALILYMHIMQNAREKDCILDFSEVLRSAPMCGDLLLSAIVELLIEGYLDPLAYEEDNHIPTFEFREYPYDDVLVA